MLMLMLVALDDVARIKGVDAIVCQIANDRLSDRTMAHIGFESHFPTSKQRHFIRRFYGKYPMPAPAAASTQIKTVDRTLVGS